MKAYDLNTKFTFGKYEGKTLEDVFKNDPEYVEKCLISEEDFAINERTMQKLFEKYPENDLSDAAIDSNLDKLDTIVGDEDDDLLFTDEVYDDDFEDLDEFGKSIGKGKGKSIDDFDDIEDDIYEEDTFEEDNWDDEDDFR